MPNWCENVLDIDGDKEEIARFVKENTTKNGCLSFQKALPLPENEEDWFNWCCDNWGTKWDISSEDDEDDYDAKMREDATSVGFYTAWSPPINWLQYVALMYPTLKFELRYGEPGNNFSGYIVIQNDEILEEEEGDCGVYYSDKYCENCEDYIYWEEKEDYDFELEICVCCRDKAFAKIKKCIQVKKCIQFKRKMACNRISRNPIFDNYFMRKVYMKRLF